MSWRVRERNRERATAVRCGDLEEKVEQKHFGGSFSLGCEVRFTIYPHPLRKLSDEATFVLHQICHFTEVGLKV